MKKIYWIGDMINNTGPAIVNKSYYTYLKDKCMFCFSNNKIIRIFSFLVNLPFRKVILLSGFSVLNFKLIRIAKLFRKKVLYLMHGYIKEETKYTKKNLSKKIIVEKKLLNCVDKIICVSGNFSSFLKKDLPHLKDKIKYINNGIDNIISLEKEKLKEKKIDDIYTIISVGGGTRIKNNIAICRAINKIYLKNKNIKFIVIGSVAEDGEEIKKYNFVEYYENLSHDEVLNKMNDSDLYVQNSYFETFGLAVVESLSYGCDLLLSKNVGAISVLKNITEEDIIENNENVFEIKKKIEKKIEEKITGTINRKYCEYSVCSWGTRSQEILKHCREERC